MQQDANGNASLAPPAPEHYIWKVEEKPITIRLAYDVVDRLYPEVMQGFGSVPKRGAEVGGLLLGRSARDNALDVVVDDYVLVHCEHRHGPSFLLSDTDRELFAAAAGKWRRDNGAERYVVGYFRSNTRAEFSLSGDDVALCEEFLPDPSNVFLLIKPFATKVSQAGFFFREDGGIRVEAPYGMFPFRRQDLGGGNPPKRTETPVAPPPDTGMQPLQPPAETEPASHGRPFAVDDRGQTPPAPVPIRALGRFAVASPGPSPIEERAPQSVPDAVPDRSPHEGMAPRRGIRGMPLPLAFVFLMLGVLLGFQAALQLQPPPPAASVDEAVRLGLNVSQHGDNLQLNWNRDAPVVRGSQGAVLVIWDGASQQSTNLDSITLRSGNVVYRRITRGGRFRLEVFLPGGSTVSETAEWRLP
jgi:hypothetical protein